MARQYINNVTMTGGLISGEGIRLGNNAGVPTYTINAAAGGSTISSPIILVNTNVSGPATFIVGGGPAANGLLISGAIRDFSSLTGLPLLKDGPGTMTLTGSNTYTGPTMIAGGAVQAIDGIGLPTSSNLVFSGSLATSGYGAVLQSSGTFSRSVGMNPGQVQWTGDGSFAANGGRLAVSMSPGAARMEQQQQ